MDEIGDHEEHATVAQWKRLVTRVTRSGDSGRSPPHNVRPVLPGRFVGAFV